MTTLDVAFRTDIIKVPEFCKKYGVSQDIMYVYAPTNKFIKKIGTTVYVFEQDLIRRREFYKKVWHKSHELYYELAEHINDNKISILLARYFGSTSNSWNLFLRGQLFSMAFVDKNIANYEVNFRLWMFFRFATFLLRKWKRLESKRTESIYHRLPHRDSYDYSDERFKGR